MLRFWVWVNGGWVRLSLRQGQTLRHATFRDTDEGWASEANVWHAPADGPGVLWECHGAGRDCDGRVDRFSAVYCPADSLAGRDMFAVMDSSENRGIYSPEWECVGASQRDCAAEAMGY
jgi:hypothetical protein